MAFATPILTATAVNGSALTYAGTMVQYDIIANSAVTREFVLQITATTNGTAPTGTPDIAIVYRWGNTPGLTAAQAADLIKTAAVTYDNAVVPDEANKTFEFIPTITTIPIVRAYAPYMYIGITCSDPGVSGSEIAIAVYANRVPSTLAGIAT